MSLDEHSLSRPVLCSAVYDNVMPYLFQRVQFGTPIGNFQGMQHQRGQVATEIEAARLLTYNAARLLDHNQEHEHAARMVWRGPQSPLPHDPACAAGVESYTFPHTHTHIHTCRHSTMRRGWPRRRRRWQ